LPQGEFVIKWNTPSIFLIDVSRGELYSARAETEKAKAERERAQAKLLEVQVQQIGSEKENE
jgi:uncharacterized protein YqfA (UPF0365 family)